MLTFKKVERLKKRKEIDALFKEGKKIKEFPVLFIYNKREKDDDIPFKVAFSISKKLVKSAVKRNKIKRQMREIYRTRKKELFECLNSKSLKHAGMLIYTSEDIPQYELLEEKIIVILERYIADI